MPGRREVLLLDGHHVLEQALDPSVAVPERARHPRRVQRVDLPIRQHPRQRGACWYRADVQAGVDLALLDPPRRLLATGEVGHRIDWHTVVFGENAPDPHARGQLELGRRDALAAQIRRHGDARVRVDVDPAVPEHPRREHRQRDERARIVVQRRDVGGQRHLRDVEFAVPQHPEERLLHRQPKVGEVDAVGTDAAVLECAGAVVVSAGERQMQAGHRSPSPGGEPPVQSWVRTAGVEFDDGSPVHVGQAEVVDVDERVVPGDAGLRIGAAHRAEHLGGEQDVVSGNHLVQQVDSRLVVDAGVEEHVAQQFGGVGPAEALPQARGTCPSDRAPLPRRAG